jgi:hypothetical protein
MYYNSLVDVLAEWLANTRAGADATGLRGHGNLSHGEPPTSCNL